MFPIRAQVCSLFELATRRETIYGPVFEKPTERPSIPTIFVIMRPEVFDSPERMERTAKALAHPAIERTWFKATKVGPDQYTLSIEDHEHVYSWRANPINDRSSHACHPTEEGKKYFTRADVIKVIESFNEGFLEVGYRLSPGQPWFRKPMVNVPPDTRTLGL